MNNSALRSKMRRTHAQKRMHQSERVRLKFFALCSMPRTREPMKLKGRRHLSRCGHRVGLVSGLSGSCKTDQGGEGCEVKSAVPPMEHGAHCQTGTELAFDRRGGSPSGNSSLAKDRDLTACQTANWTLVPTSAGPRHRTPERLQFRQFLPPAFRPRRSAGRHGLR
jgi:hypothetical protein